MNFLGISLLFKSRIKYLPPGIAFGGGGGGLTIGAGGSVYIGSSVTINVLYSKGLFNS